MGPICNRCGVEYVESYEGPCQERRWGGAAGLKDLGACGGRVSWQATVERLERELAEVKPHVEEAIT